MNHIVTKPVPEKCQICETAGTPKMKEHGFVDGATRTGPWANMCISCHAIFGIGLGIGRGQRYDKDGVKVQYAEA